MRMLSRRLVDAVRWRVRAGTTTLRALPARTTAWLAAIRGRRRYQLLDEAALRHSRRSDTVFIFGSGWSLNAIPAEEWSAIEAHDTIGFNWFVRQSFVRCDYQFVREIAASDTDGVRWRTDLAEYFDLIRRNPRYADTIFLVQCGFRAINGNRAIGYGYLPIDKRVFPWRSLSGRADPSPSLSMGLTHRHGTLNECINFAALLGWRRIVLVGVDLYDRRYFWLPSNQPREGDSTVDGAHNTALAGIVDGVRAWRDIYARQGIQLYAYNSRSLLVPTLPVWNWQALNRESA
jgi:hypothetical protein